MGRSGRLGAGPTWALEREAHREGFCRVAGIDEVGRGCLFGPVFAAAVVLDPDVVLPGLDDSKRLSPKCRETLDERIRETAADWALGAVDAARIDFLNILQASRLAMRLAVEALSPAPDFLLVDALAVDSDIAQRAVVRGDSRSCSIAAASIVAKAARDRCMLAWDAMYPEYGLRSHKGYPVKTHVRAIREHGCLPQHRRSFAPIARLAQLDPRRPPEGYTVDT